MPKTLAEAVKDVDLVVLCTPVSKIIPLIESLLPHLKQGAVITDVGSVKGPLVNQADDLMPEGIFFVGSHPIAGGKNQDWKHRGKIYTSMQNVF